MCVLLGHRTLWLAVSQEWMKKFRWFFACWYMVSGKLKITLNMHMALTMHMAKYGCNLLGPGTLKSTLSQLKNKLMNWSDFSHARSDVIIFG